MKIITKLITAITVIFVIGFVLVLFLTREGGEGALAVGIIFGGPCIIGIFISGILGVFTSIALIIMDKNKDDYLYLMINSLPAIALFIKIWSAGGWK